MNFRTKVNVKNIGSLDHGQRILSMGSCFAEEIGLRLKNLKYSIDVNPFGIMYNPISICQGLDLILRNKRFDESDLFFYEGLWHSYKHHGNFSCSNKIECLKRINNRLESVNLQNIDVLIITLGTSWVYELKENGEVVSNCHKMQNSIFNRRRLCVDEIVKKMSSTIRLLKNRNDSMKILFTVSPIRHIGDGLHNNELSKSTLLLAIDIMQNEFFNIEYFPAYEIVLDELRDYRFYDKDMCHVSDCGLDYVFERFEDCYCSKQEISLNEQIIKIKNAVNHRALRPESDDYKKFCKSILYNIEDLEKNYTYLNFDNEKRILNERIYL